MIPSDTGLSVSVRHQDHGNVPSDLADAASPIVRLSQVPPVVGHGAITRDTIMATEVAYLTVMMNFHRCVE